MSIRSTAKAIILHDGKVLLNSCIDSRNGEYYSLPGGGQHEYETLCEAVVRECKEETGYEVRPVRLAGVCEEICLDEKLRKEYPDYMHKVYHIFLCALSGDKRGTPTEEDTMQTGSEWVAVGDLPRVRLLPEVVGTQITGLLNGEAPIFLGSERIRVNHG